MPNAPGFQVRALAGPMPVLYSQALDLDEAEGTAESMMRTCSPRAGRSIVITDPDGAVVRRWVGRGDAWEAADGET